jgi:hypothetical protein
LARITRPAGATGVVVDDPGAADVGAAVGTAEAEPAVVVTGAAAVVDGEPIGTGALVTIVATAVGAVVEVDVVLVDVDDVVVDEVVVEGEPRPPQPATSTSARAQATTRRDMDSESRSPPLGGEVNRRRRSRRARRARRRAR